MPPLVAALPLISAGVGAAGSIMSGIAAKNQDDYKAQIAMRNAVVAGMSGEQEIQAGQQSAAMRSLKGAASLARTKTAMAANNVDINRGSAVNVRAGERAENVLSSQTQLWNAQNKQWGYAQQAEGDVAQAKLDRAAGSQAMLGGMLGGASSILSGLGNTFAPGSGGIFGSAAPTSSPLLTSSQSAPSGQGGIGSDFVSGGGDGSVVSSSPYTYPGAYSP